MAFGSPDLIFSSAQSGSAQLSSAPLRRAQESSAQLSSAPFSSAQRSPAQLSSAQLSSPRLGSAQSSLIFQIFHPPQMGRFINDFNCAQAGFWVLAAHTPFWTFFGFSSDPLLATAQRYSPRTSGNSCAPPSVNPSDLEKPTCSLLIQGVGGMA